jgi:hypothetical protein
VLPRDLIAQQLGLLEALEYLRVWEPVGDQGRRLLEVVRAEDPAADAQFLIEIDGDLKPDQEQALAALGFTQSLRRRDVSEVDGATSLVVQVVCILLQNQNPKISITHGSHYNRMLVDRKLEALVSATKKTMSQAFKAVAANDQVPVPFFIDNVQINIWPKAYVDAAVIEVWSLVSRSTPIEQAVLDLVSSRNHDFNFGRLLLREDNVWYRDNIHAEPYSENALTFAVQVAMTTAKDNGKALAELGGINATIPQPATPMDKPTPPEEEGRGPYL